MDNELKEMLEQIKKQHEMIFSMLLVLAWINFMCLIALIII